LVLLLLFIIYYLLSYLTLCEKKDFDNVTRWNFTR